MRCELAGLRRAVDAGLVLFLTSFLAAGPCAFRAWAEPVLQEVVSGEVDVEQLSPADVDAGGYDAGIEEVYQIQSSASSIGHYGSLDVYANERVEVIFPDGVEGRHLARVMNGLETQRLGQVFSEGHVYIVNPAGVFIGSQGWIDVAGFHAIAGDIDESLFLGSTSSDRYLNLVGRVENQGVINAQIVDLVGRFVTNRGSIEHSDVTGTLDGYFVLAVGDDVFVRRLSRTDEDGFDVTVRIEGLAGAVLDAMTGDSIADVEQLGAIEAGGLGEVVLSAGISLGAGDIVANAMRFGGTSSTVGRKIVAAARGGDVVLETGASLEAEQI